MIDTKLLRLTYHEILQKVSVCKLRHSLSAHEEVNNMRTTFEPDDLQAIADVVVRKLIPLIGKLTRRRYELNFVQRS